MKLMMEKQAIGRALRLHKNKAVVKIYDIADSTIKLLYKDKKHDIKK